MAPQRPELLRWPTTYPRRARALRTPHAITDLSGFGGTGSVLLTWTTPDPGGSPITGYVIQRSTTSASAGFSTLEAALAPTASYVDSAVVNGTQYWYRVRAYNSIGFPDYSNVVTATPTAPADPPAAVADLAAVAGDTEVDLTWSAPSSTQPIASYDVHYSIVSNAGPWTTAANDLAPATSYTVTGLANDVVTYFRIRATSSEGDGPWSNIDSATPEAATGITVVGGTEFDGTSTATTHPITLPTGIQAGDLICIWSSTQSAASDGAPTASGYTQRYSQGHASSFRPLITLLYKIAVGTESGTSVTLTWGTSCDANMVCVVFRGVDGTTPFDQTSPASTNGGSNPDPASITTVTDDAWVIHAITGNHATSVPTPTISTGYTVAYSQVPDLKSLVIAYKQVATAGADNGSAWTWGPLDNHTATVTALRPGAVVPPPTPEFPNVESVTESNTTTGVSHLVNMPATVNADDRLVMVVFGMNASFGPGANEVDGWTLMLTRSVLDIWPYYIYQRKADGTEDGTTVEFTSGSSTTMSAQVYRISGVDTSGGVGTSIAIANDTSTGFTLNPNSPSVASPWGSAKNLVISGFLAGSSGGTVTANPAGYTAGADGAAASQVWMGTAYADVEAASADPGAFTITDGTAGENVETFTIICRPTVGGSSTGTPAPTIPTFTSTVTISTAQNGKSIIEAAAAGTHFTVLSGTHTSFSGVKLKSNMHVRLATGCILEGSGLGYCFRPNDQNVTGVAIGGDPGGTRPIIRNYGNGTSNQDFGAIMGQTDDFLAGQYQYRDVDNWFIYHLDLERNSSNGLKLGSNFTVYDVETHGHTVTGIGGDRIVGGLIHSCLFYWNALNPASGSSSNGANLKVTWVNGAVGRTSITPVDRTAARLVVSNCVFEANDRDGGPGNCDIGFWADLDCEQILVEYSTFDDFSTSGIFAEGSNGIEISNNTVRNCDGFGPAYNGNFSNAAIATGESTNCNIHDNTIIDSTYGLMNRMSNRTGDWLSSTDSNNYGYAAGPRYWLLNTQTIPANPGQSNVWTGNNVYERNTLINCSFVVINEGTDGGGQTTHGSTDLNSIDFVDNDYAGSPSIRFYNASGTQLTLAQWQGLAYTRDQ